jgi:1-pyrroline-5-carboxylate dehydrogenase
VNGEWSKSASSAVFPDPMNGKDFMTVPNTSLNEISPFVQSLNTCPKSGLHNPFKNPERYLLYG